MKTDAQLQHDVLAELQWEPSVQAAGIGVEVRDGVVTLVGEVGSLAEKWNAERATQRVAGVKALAVEMTVKLDEFGRRTDADIARSAANILGATASLPRDAVKVLVQGSWVTLSGIVAWQFQRQAAADSLRGMPGVTGVSNQIAIQPALTAVVVKADIEAALTRRAAAEANAIGVDVQGADVTLTGTVHSWAERDLATGSAWAAAGVRRVIDHMTMQA
jgi:osmotically-inducible protein OsmY